MKKNFQSGYWDSLKSQEINILIGVYRQRIRSLMKEYNLRKNAEKDEFRKEYLTSSSLEELSKDLLIRIGFKTPIYLEESVGISRKFHLEYDWYKNHGRYSNDLLATCIIAQILNYYDVNYNTSTLLSIYDISRVQLFKLYQIIDSWCQDEYWKKA